MKKIITSPNGPKPIGPYSHAVLAENTLYTSGQVGIDPKTNELVVGDIKDETKQAMLNLKNILETAGTKMSNIVKATIFLKDLNNFTAMNEVYGSFFESDFPARETVQVVRLPKDANVEISVIAVLD
ncbi:MAG: RidA family protein [Bacteroidia bacterium]